MTRIIIESVIDRASLIAAVATVLDTMNDESAFERETHTFVPARWEEGDHDALAEQARPLPRIPCPRRGQHIALTECWMCWCDVMRGAALAPEVLTEAAWSASQNRGGGSESARNLP